MDWFEKCLRGMEFAKATAKITERFILKYETEISPPAAPVSIILPSFNEERYIKYALISIKNQNLLITHPNSFEVILVDSGSKDQTVKFAEPYVDRIIISERRGKLTARNLATDLSAGKIIISVDGDCFYPQNWLNTLLSPFSDPNTAGVNGSTVDYSDPIIPGEVNTLCFLAGQMLLWPNRMYGRNSAFWKWAFYQAGGFNENVNQLNVEEMIEEEEVGFGNRLAMIGKVVYKFNATCMHLGGDKIACRRGIGTCREKLGVDRF